jgi:hypothetical protein
MGIGAPAGLQLGMRARTASRTTPAITLQYALLEVEVTPTAARAAASLPVSSTSFVSRSDLLSRSTGCILARLARLASSFLLFACRIENQVLMVSASSRMPFALSARKLYLPGAPHAQRQRQRVGRQSAHGVCGGHFLWPSAPRSRAIFFTTSAGC